VIILAKFVNFCYLKRDFWNLRALNDVNEVTYFLRPGGNNEIFSESLSVENFMGIAGMCRLVNRLWRGEGDSRTC
jgi:hypothetical protein